MRGLLTTNINVASKFGNMIGRKFKDLDEDIQLELLKLVKINRPFAISFQTVRIYQNN